MDENFFNFSNKRAKAIVSTEHRTEDAETDGLTNN